MIYGIGGVGINAVQGAAFAGARNVIAVDPLEFKRENAMEFGATHVAASADEAAALVLCRDPGRGRGSGADHRGRGDRGGHLGGVRRGAQARHGRDHRAGRAGSQTIQIPSFELTLFEKRIQGALFGSGNPFDTIPKLLELYQAGQLKLDELVTTRYSLDEVNPGYRDMLDGRNIRGLLIHES